MFNFEWEQFLGLPFIVAVIVIIVRLVRKIPARPWKLPLDMDLLRRRLEDFHPESLMERRFDRNFREVPRVADDPDAINFARVDFLSLADSEAVSSAAIECIKNYGVGTCGPRAFYGTIDVHLTLEKHLADFMRMEEAIVYAYGFTTISSSIACYFKEDDILFIDGGVNVAIQQGVAVSKSKKITFKHNNVNDFSMKLEQYDENDSTRKILIIEGIYYEDGTICPLPDLVRVCKEHKVRIFVDETISFGTLGDEGRGVTEYYGIDVSEIDMIVGSLEHALSSVGGFCIGSKSIIEHQRLSSFGYAFSASLPAYSAQAAITVLDNIENRPKELNLLSNIVHDFLSEMPKLKVKSHRDSPVKVFSIKGDMDMFLDLLRTKKIYVLKCEGYLKMNLYVDLYRNNDKLQELFDIVKNSLDLCK